MSLREELLEYINKVPVPEEFLPENMGKTLFPEQKRLKPTAADSKQLLSVSEAKEEKASAVSNGGLLSVPEIKAENKEKSPLISLPQDMAEEKPATSLRKENKPLSEKNIIKKEAVNEQKTVQAPQQKEPSKPLVQQAEKSSAPVENKKAFELNAYSFMKIVQSQKLTGSEFLQLIGNSRIGNKAYLEIEQNPNLTQKRLVEILEESGLTADDYEKLLIAINKRSKLKQASLEQLRAKEKVQTERRRQTELSAQKLVELAEKKRQAEKQLSDRSEEAEKAQPEEENKEPISPDDSARDNLPEKAPEQEEKRASHDEGDDESPDEGYVNGMNATKIGVVFALAALLLIISFGLRYYYTGSFFITEDEQAEPLVIETGEQLFDAMSGLRTDAAPAVAENTLYTANGVADDKIRPMPTASNGDYLFICKNNTLYVVETVGGQMKQKEKADYSGELMGVVLHDNDFYVISVETGVSTPFTYNQTITETDSDGEETEKTVAVSDVLVRDYLQIQCFDGENADEKIVYRQSGMPTELIFADGKICAVTFENMPGNAAASVYETYLPHYFFGEKQTLAEITDIYLPENALCKSFLTIGLISTADSNCKLTAVAGGSAPVVFCEGENIFVAQNGTADTLLMRYDISEGVPVPDGTCTADGLAGTYSGLDVSDGIIRFTTLSDSGEGVTLSVYDSGLNLLSRASGLAYGANPAATCFDDINAYVVAENGEQLMLYGVNTLNSSDLTLLTEVTAEITSDKYRRWNDSYSLYLCAEASDDGLRTNLLLSTITDGGIVADSLEIKAESTVEGDWNKYLSSPAEADIQLIKGSEENGCLLLPVIYFDGISEIEKVLILTVDQNGKLSRTGEIVQYDLRSDTLLAEVSGKYCYCIFGDAIFSADSEKASVISQLELK